MPDRDHSNFWILMLAGIGAGALTGTILGLLAVRRPRSGPYEEMTETVDDLKRRAEQILTDLSQSYPVMPEMPHSLT
jgi:hypothetical protein